MSHYSRSYSISNGAMITAQPVTFEFAWDNEEFSDATIRILVSDSSVRFAALKFVARFRAVFDCV